ncbi:hypothetical protein KY360_00570 [Candidatus Woesearchaeota archaeon]|nr:hypothetical protein [Candidatus Woesearchaeota archaeon]
MKKTILLLLVMFSLVSGMAEANCCINPNADSGDFCVEADQDRCCPDDSQFPWFYDPAEPRAPNDRADCLTSFFLPEPCEQIDECFVSGCCCWYNPEMPDIIERAEPALYGMCVGNVAFEEFNESFLPESCGTAFCQTVSPIGCVPGDPCSTIENCPGEWSVDCLCEDVFPDDECPLECNVASLNAQPVKGKKILRLEWVDGCPTQALTYTLERCDGIDCDEFSVLATLTDGTSYDDASVEWDTTYTYNLIVNYGSLGTDSIEIINVLSGNVECWDKFTGDPFCINGASYYTKIGDNHPTYEVAENSANYKRAFSCDTDNNLIAYGTPPVDCTGGMCLIDKDTGEPMCIWTTECDRSFEAHPFGLYSNQQLCEEDQESGLRAYCFYDRSYTIVDDCYECKPYMACYDYKSRTACEKDNCGIGSGNCEWHPTYGTDSDFIGVCVDAAGSNCEWCDKHGSKYSSSDFMGNLDVYNKIFDQCTQEKANALETIGFDCYWFDGRAFDCSSLTCRGYGSEADCENTDTSQLCVLGVCKWWDIGGCYKNADGDDTRDCGFDPNDPICEADVFAPNTTFVPLINIQGIYTGVIVELHDKNIWNEEYGRVTELEGYSTYLCIDGGCSGGYTETAALSFVIEDSAGLELCEVGVEGGSECWTLQPGENEIKYYSIDPNKNQEGPKSLIIYAYEYGAGPTVSSVLVGGGTLVNKIDQVIEENPTWECCSLEYAWYTNNIRPQIGVEFVKDTTVSSDPGGVLVTRGDGNLQTASVQKTSGKIATISLEEDLAEQEYTLTLSNWAVKSDAKLVTRSRNFFVDFIVDTTPPSVVQKDVAEGDMINDSNVTSEFVFDEPVKILSASLDGVNVTASVSSSEYDEMHIATLEDLLDGWHTLEILARDYAGNVHNETITFLIDAVPIVIEIIEPSYGVSAVDTFDIVIQTDNEVTCKYNLDVDSSYDFSNPFDQSGGTMHTKNNFELRDTNPHLLYVKCTSAEWDVVGKVFNLKYDPTPPNITTAYAYPDPVVEVYLTTELKVQADDPVRCKYSAVSGIDYQNMDGKFGGWDEGEFEIIDTGNVTVDGEGNFTFYVACENEAELISETVPVSFMVNLSIPLMATDLTPEYVNVTPELSVRTNKDAECYYDTDSDVGSGRIAFSRTGGKNHKSTLEQLIDGTYTYYARCTGLLPDGTSTWSNVVEITFTVDSTPPNMVYVDDTNIFLSANPELSCPERLLVKWLADDNVSSVSLYSYSLLADDGSTVKDWTEDGSEDEWVKVTNTGNGLGLEDGEIYFFYVKAVNPAGLWSEPMLSDGVTMDSELCDAFCNNTKDNCCYAEDDGACDPDCMQGFDPDCGDCTNAEGDCCDIAMDGICDPDCIPYVDIDCKPVCDAGECDSSNNMWCDAGFWTNESYCDDERCLYEDPDCGALCSVEGYCDTDSKNWCSDGAWTEENYCAHCSIKDSSCPVCEVGVCDTESQVWCNEGIWSSVDYCARCGEVDAYCNVTCRQDACDLTSRQWCDAGSWSDEDYCDHCGDVDSRCDFICSDDYCDTTARVWCSNGVWNESGYCEHCGDLDASCELPCYDDACDAENDAWCDAGVWNAFFSDYCLHCDDSDCPGVCSDLACDTSTNKWCDAGAWVEEGYCNRCGSFDSDCDIECVNGSCDIVSDEWCDAGEWRTTAYCDYCTFFDFDSCAVACADGDCDKTNQKWCSAGTWSEENYCPHCFAVDSTCPSECANIADDCCNTAADGTCDSDCMQGADPDCGDCTSAAGDCCNPAPDGMCDADCTAGIDPDCSEVCLQTGTCPDGHPCQDDVVCDSGWCDDGFCAATSCDDNIENGDETDVDCGGDCDPCEDGENCISNSDCESNNCRNGICTTLGECEDKTLTNGESDIDCGGPCPGCMVGDFCNTDDDCVAGVQCVNSICTAPAGRVEEDSDGDGMSDQCELTYGLNPSNPDDAPLDYDDDGLTNLDECSYGTDPNNPDTDGDGFDDGKEIEEGTDPLDPESHPESKLMWILLLIAIILAILGLVGYLVYILWGDQIKDKVAVMMGKKPPVKPMPYRPVRPMLRRPVYRPIVRPAVRRPARAPARREEISKLAEMFKVPVKERGKPESALEKLKAISGKPEKVGKAKKPAVKGKPSAALEKLKAISARKKAAKPGKKIVKAEKGKPLTALEKLKAISGKPEAKPAEKAEKPAEKGKPVSALEKLKAISGKPKEVKPAKPRELKPAKKAAKKPKKPRKRKRKAVSKTEIKIVVKPEVRAARPARKPKKAVGKKLKKEVKTMAKKVAEKAAKAAAKTTAKKEVKKASESDAFKKLAELSKKKK